jgi:hypothetical protein
VISFRFVPVMSVLLGLALIPTIIHSYAGALESDGRTTEAIPVSLAGYQSTPTDRNPTWGERRFESTDWTERTYTGGGDRVRLTVVRSFDAKSLYHHPELAVAYGVSFVGSDATHVQSRPDIPVHVLTPGDGVTARGLYALHYDGRFIANPVSFQLRTAGELLVGARKPMTLFFALDEDAAGEGDLENLGALRLLFAAIDAFVAQPEISR